MTDKVFLARKKVLKYHFAYLLICVAHKWFHWFFSTLSLRPICKVVNYIFAESKQSSSHSTSTCENNWNAFSTVSKIIVCYDNDWLQGKSCENGVNINFYVCNRKPNFHCACVDLSWKAFMLVSCFLSKTIDFWDKGEYVFWNIIEFCLKWWRYSWDNMSSETSTSQICNLIKLFYCVILFSKLT